jgi:thiamine transport system ATP-binding protein
MATDALELQAVTVAYGDTVAVDRLDLTVADGEIVAVLGPSGCGKSTLLRTVAGLEHPTDGRVLIDGRDVTALRPDRRGVGLMFQDHALFPHRTVAENVGFGPRMHGTDPAGVRERVAEVLALVHLDGFGDRPVTELSGGEQQRVALARALAPDPRILMLDEPLGSLDRALGDQLLDELERVLRELGTSVVYVTHDQDEALAIADRVVVMRAGRVLQAGTPDELWRAPATEFVARFLGLEHVLALRVSGGVAHGPLGPVPLPGVADGDHLAVLLPDALRRVTGEAPRRGGEVMLAGRVLSRRFAGDHVRLRVRTEPGMEISVPAWRGVGPSVDDDVELAVDPSTIRLLAPDPDG